MTEDKHNIPALYGGCACGEITFTSTLLPSRGIVYCYCSTCQRISGAPYLPFVELSMASFKWTTAQPAVFRKTHLAERFHCPACGSTLGMQYHNEPNKISIVAAAIDRATASIGPPKCHIFVKEKPTWYQIPEDELPQYDYFSS